MGELTVRRDGGPDVTGDTVRFDGDELVVLDVDGKQPVPIDEARSVIAGRPASGQGQGGAP